MYQLRRGGALLLLLAALLGLLPARAQAEQTGRSSPRPTPRG